MKKPAAKPTLTEKISHAYEALLDSALKKAHQGGTLINNLADEVQEDISALNELSRDEIALLKAYVRRDLVDAATYLNVTGKGLQDWLGFDLALIESELLYKFSEATDKTTLEFMAIQRQAEVALYNTGELTGMGTLVCTQCGGKLHFHKPSHIPPCAKCHNTHFNREQF